MGHVDLELLEQVGAAAKRFVVPAKGKATANPSGGTRNVIRSG